MTKPFPIKRPGWLLGVDTSAAQGVLDVQALRAAGVDFAIFKATDGLRGVDGQWPESSAAAGAIGFPFAAYGVIEPNEDPVAQAAHYVATVKDAGGTLPPCLDFELAHGMSGSAALNAAAAWVQEVEDSLGRGVVVYTGPAFISTLERFAGATTASIKALGARPLWVAHYGVAAPTVPPPWGEWSLWQASGDGGSTLPTSSIAVDVDWFRGTLADLEGLGLEYAAG